MITHQISSPPLLSQFEPNHHMTQHHPMKKTIAGLSASSSTSLPAPPLSLNIGIPTLATILEIDNLPQPPADLIEQSQTSPIPPSSMSSNIPSALPLPNSFIQSLVM
ncbi:unnamed protein product [Rotaria socialis]|uniref:Uncharacterized protein n=1 Tax=Rotaria socialis TaxID=392032 RepID=A0A821W5S8_9BILA|nr:unnamed protein product [Rotaria socialis]CAF3324967.1 unnamed protein product [Rotaria socialis]CAF3551804.1 unnamed protein product [Rotaria socialis]CAF3645619.1 unnamed protein product [Rotaria socialis]CAF4574429.1 unnamed protein product [Rotaria socialis]